MLPLSPHACRPPHGVLVSAITFAILLPMWSFYQVPTRPFALPSSETQTDRFQARVL